MILKICFLIILYTLNNIIKMTKATRYFGGNDEKEDMLKKCEVFKTLVMNRLGNFDGTTTFEEQLSDDIIIVVPPDVDKKMNDDTSSLINYLLKKDGNMLENRSGEVVKYNKTNGDNLVLSSGNVSSTLTKCVVENCYMADANFENLKFTTKSEVKGGAEIQGLERQALFEKTLCDYFKKEENDAGCDTAMELIVSFHDYLSENGENELLKVIESQCSYDSLTSLAIILQPYKKEGTKYIDEDLLQKMLKTICSVGGFLNAKCYTLNSNVQTKYEQLCNKEYTKNYADYKKMLKGCCKKFLVDYVENTKLEIDMRDKMLADEKLAEAELRVVAAIMHQNGVSKDDALDMYRSHNLIKPYYDFEDGKNMSITTYYSLFHLMARSDALVYVPGCKDDKLEEFPNNNRISINKTFKVINNSKRDNSSRCVKECIEQLEKFAAMCKKDSTF